MSISRWVSCFVRSLPSAHAASEKAIVIDHRQSWQVADTDVTAVSRIQELRWFFAHASVGSNILDGLTELHTSGSNRFQMKFVSAGALPAGETKGGVVYEHNRGNPGWRAKIDGFERLIGSGWNFPVIDIAMNKLCYIDQWASVKYYVHSMCELEEQFPQTSFVYVTMPLTTAKDFRNYRRNIFNEKLRTWCRDNGKVLFDLADIEAHDRAGQAATFNFRDRPCQRLCDQYTEDGGHLNREGRQAAAMAIYALAAALVDDRLNTRGGEDHRYGVASRAMPSLNLEANGRRSTSSSVIN